MPVHELEPLVADVSHKGGRYSGEKWVGQILWAGQAKHVPIMIAGDVDGVHAGQTVQERFASVYDAVEWISKQLEKVPDDDQLPPLVLNVSEEGVEKRLAIGSAQVITWGSVPDMQIADDKDRFVLVDRATLYCSTGWLDPATRLVLLCAHISVLHVKPAFGLR